VIGQFSYSAGQIKNERKRSLGQDSLMANKRMHEEDSFFPHADNYQNFYGMDNGVMAQNAYAFTHMQQQMRSQDPSSKVMAGGQSKAMMMDGYYRSQAMPYAGYPNPTMPGMISPTNIGLTSMLTGDTAATMSNQRPASGYVAQPPPPPPPQQQQQQQRGAMAQQQQQQQRGAMAQQQQHAVPNYATYPGLLNKANLKIIGDLDTMGQAWTAEEWNGRRRLVQFWRRQEGNEIHCDFQAVQQADRQPNSIVVSCIYWQERNDCFITSVDCIYLLESLIGVRFTVEEKNRIRRNLEGFRPLTVSKCKADSADFFKLIMSFPNPKPRNIEKDVKVFPWKTLPYALKKIIGKYTASYSSTAGIM